MLKRILTIIFSIIIVSIICFFIYSVFINIKKFERIKNNNLSSIIKQPDSLFLYSYEKKNFDSIDIKGEKVFIHFWATWCKPCIEEFNMFDSILKGNKNYNVFFISNEDTIIVNSFLQNKKLNNIPFFGLNKNDSIFRHDILPTTYYTESNGILKIKTGKNDWLSLLKENKNGKTN